LKLYKAPCGLNIAAKEITFAVTAARECYVCADKNKCSVATVYDHKCWAKLEVKYVELVEGENYEVIDSWNE
jgi:hypothetical protein